MSEGRVDKGQSIPETPDSKKVMNPGGAWMRPCPECGEQMTLIRIIGKGSRRFYRGRCPVCKQWIELSK